MDKKRTYQETHSWLTFQWDAGKAPWKFWVLLGSAQSKCIHISGVPLTNRAAEELHKVYLAKGAAATTRIEGNTLTEDQVRQIADGNLDLADSKHYLQQEVENVLSIYRDTELVERPLTPSLIKELNARILQGLKSEDHVQPGEFTRVPIGVAAYRGAPPEDIPFLVERLCDWLDHKFQAPDPKMQMHFDIVRAFLAHLYIAWIHPFGDGNGRTARALEYLILLKSGIPQPAALIPTTFFCETRTEYYRQLDQATKSGGEVSPFLEYSLQGFVDGLVEQIKTVQRQHLELSWLSYVQEYFRLNTPMKGKDVRRRDLIEALSRLPQDMVTFSASEGLQDGLIPKLPPKLAREYLERTEKTLQRDLQELRDCKMIEYSRQRIRVCKERILAFRPYHKNDEK